MYKQEHIIQKKASRFLLISSVVKDYHLSSCSSYGIHCKHKKLILHFQKDLVEDCID